MPSSVRKQALLKVSALALVFALPLPTFAMPVAGGMDSGGGNDVGLDFEAAAMRAIENLPSAQVTDAQRQQMLVTLRNAHFVVVDHSLTVNAGKSEQPSEAVNDPATQTITIDESGWSKLTLEEQKQPLAAHEILSLMGIEHTGDYHLSATLRNAETTTNYSALPAQVAQMDSQALKTYQKQLFAQMTVPHTKRTPYEVLKELYDTAPRAATPQDLPTCDLIDELSPSQCGDSPYLFLMPIERSSSSGTLTTMPWIVPSTSLASMQNGAKLAPYRTNVYGMQMVNVEISAAIPGTPATPGAGPLFPGKAATSEKPAVLKKEKIFGPVYLPRQKFPDNTDAEFVAFNYDLAFAPGSPEVILPEGQLAVMPVKGGQITTQTTSELTLHVSLGDEQIVYSLRKSGDLLVLKAIYHNSVYYNYGWKDPS